MPRGLIVLVLAACAAAAREGPVEAAFQAHPGGRRIGGKLAVPVVRRDAGAVVASVRASKSWLALDGEGTEVLDGTAGLAILQETSRHLWFANGGIGIGAEEGAQGSRAWLATLAGGGSRRVGDSLRLGAGVSLSLRHEEVGLHPFLALLWRHASGLELSGRIPARLSLSWRPMPAWETGGLWRFEGGEFARADFSANLRVQRLALEGFATRDLGSRLSLEVALGWLVHNRIRSIEAGRTEWNLWGYELGGSRRSTIVEDRPGPVARVQLALRLRGDGT